MISLEWFEQDRKDSDGDHYQMHFLVHQSGRVMASIDTPRKYEFCFCVGLDKGSDRKYITLESAKQYAESECRKVLNEEIRQKALSKREKVKR